MEDLRREKTQLQMLISQEKKNKQTNTQINKKIEKLNDKMQKINKDMVNLQNKMDKLLK